MRPIVYWQQAQYSIYGLKYSYHWALAIVLLVVRAVALVRDRGGTAAVITVFPRIILRSTINFDHKIFKNFVTTIRGCSII